MVDTWKLSDATSWRQLKRAFANRHIDFSAPGFFDSPEFLLAEKSDPAFLVTYARFVESRPYEAGYLREARRRCVVASRILGSLVAEDGRLGACVDVSGMFARMLDLLGVWNYCAKATLTMEMKSGRVNPRYYWVLDDGEFVAAHAFVVAPPFSVVDMTVRYQPNLGPYADLLPQNVLSDSAIPG